MKPLFGIAAAACVASLIVSRSSAAAEPDTATLNGIRVPVTLNGRWDLEGRVGNTWSLEVDRIHPDGRMEGRVTWWGVRCSVKGETISDGTWRDGRLKLRAPMDNRHACGDLVVDLGAGSTRFFEGSATNTVNSATTVKAWLDGQK